MLTSRQPMWIGWGDELMYLYNDAYKSIIGGKHPEALGQPSPVVWREIWDVVGPLLATAMRGNEGTYDEALLLIMERNGYPEETYYTFSYSPVPNDQGGIGGIICANTDDTDADSVSGSSRCCASWPAHGRCAHWRRCLRAGGRGAGARAARDLPFALMYFRDGAGCAGAAAGIERGSCRGARAPWRSTDRAVAAREGAACDRSLRWWICGRGGRIADGRLGPPPSQASSLLDFAAGDTTRAGCSSSD